jgi:peptidoglycan/LPS O-acetylase OafA/YrhL
MFESKKQLLPLTGMRFFLALWVVIFHQPFFHGYSWMAAFPSPFPSLFNTGYLAVGIFFTLSGFVLAYNYPLGKSWSPDYVKRYAVARFSRIYPAYALGLLLAAPWVATAVLKNFSTVKACQEVLKGGLAWSLLQAWVPPAAEAWNAPSWSLSVEAFFYCCFPLLGLALWRISRLRNLVFMGLTIWAVALIAPLLALKIPLLDAHGIPASSWSRESTGFWVNFIRFTPLLQLPQFCMGIVMARVYSLLQNQDSALLGRGYLFYIPGIILEVAGIVLYQAKLYPLLHNGLLLPFHSLAILGFALDGGVIARFLSLRPLVFLGNASYSMYIFHAVIGAWISGVAKRLASASLEGFAVTGVYIVLVIAFSSFIYKYFEEPVHVSLKKKLLAWFSAPRRESERTIPAGVECAH